MIQDARRVVSDMEYIPVDPQEFAGRIFTTCYMATENSSRETHNRAKELAGEIGRYGHMDYNEQMIKYSDLLSFRWIPLVDVLF